MVPNGVHSRNPLRGSHFLLGQGCVHSIHPVHCIVFTAKLVISSTCDDHQGSHRKRDDFHHRQVTHAPLGATSTWNKLKMEQAKKPFSHMDPQKANLRRGISSWEWPRFWGEKSPKSSPSGHKLEPFGPKVTTRRDWNPEAQPDSHAPSGKEPVHGLGDMFMHGK